MLLRSKVISIQLLLGYSSSEMLTQKKEFFLDIARVYI